MTDSDDLSVSSDAGQDAQETPPRSSVLLIVTKLLISVLALAAATRAIWEIAELPKDTREEWLLLMKHGGSALILVAVLIMITGLVRARGWKATLAFTLSSTVLAAAVVQVYGVWQLPRKQEKQPEPVQREVNVRTKTVRPVPALPDILKLPAVIEANRVVSVAAEVDGRIEEIACEEGAAIQVGKAIVKLNTELLLAEYERAKAKLEYDRKQYERVQGLVTDGVGTAKDLDDVAVSLEVSRATLESVEARLERTTINSPVKGIVNLLHVEEGEYVRPGSVVAQIVDIDTVKAVVHVPERDIAFFSIGDEVELSVNHKRTVRELTGAITYIAELADRQTRSTRIEVTVDNRDAELRSGQIIDAHLMRRTLRDVILVPLETVISMEHGKAVYIINDGKAVRRDVKLGLIKGREVRILSGLQSGDRLIVSGHRMVSPGQEVNVLDADEPVPEDNTKAEMSEKK